MEKGFDHQHITDSSTICKTVSLEALAMADVDHLSFCLDFEQWERENDECVPEHLLMEEEDNEEHHGLRSDLHEKIICEDSKLSARLLGQLLDMKRCLHLWVKRVMVDLSNG